MRLLLIEDDPLVADTVADGVRQQFVVEVAGTGARGLYRAQTNEFAAIVLDLRLPDMDGIEICVALRRERPRIPIVVLSALREVQARIDVLDAGADDCLTKPFSLAELCARLQAVLRRSRPDPQPVLMAGGLTLDPVRRIVTVDGTPVLLRRREFELLEYLLSYRGHVLGRSRIMDAVWGDRTDGLTNTVDVHIKLLRDKIDRPFQTNHIRTVRGVGYTVAA